jgi:hypothetical protein
MAEEHALLGTMPDRLLAKRLNRSLASIRGRRNYKGVAGYVMPKARD